MADTDRQTEHLHQPTGSLFLLVTGDFRRTGGMDMANFALADHLARRGAEVHLVAHHVADELLARPGVIWHRVPKPAGSNFLGEPLLDRVGRHFARRIAARGGRVVVNGGNCAWADVNWAHYVHAAYKPELKAAWPGRLKAAVHRRRSLRAEARALRCARVILANSERTRRDVIERLGVPESRVATVYYGIDPARFGPITRDDRGAARARLGWPADRPTVGFIGAMSDRRKGFDVLYEAWRRLGSAGPWDVDLAVVGAGAEVAAWRDRASRDGLAGQVRFLGFTSEVPRVLAACDALVHPARYEAYGLGVHEALCRGLPALVSARAGVAERYPRRLAHLLLLPDPENVADLCDRLRVWRKEIDATRLDVAALGDQLRARSWDDMARDILEVIDRSC